MVINDVRTHSIGVRTGDRLVDNVRRRRKGVACCAPTDTPCGNLSNGMVGFPQGALHATSSPNDI